MAETAQPVHTPATKSDQRDSSSSPTATSRSPIQLRGMSLSDQEAALAPAGNDFASQAAALAPVQRHDGGGGTEGVHAAAAHGLSGSGGAMPHAGAIQQAFGGHDISHVKAHTDAKAQEGTKAMGAEAYASGSSVAFGGAPSLHTAAHEAAHIVQQQAGVSLSGGVGKSGDSYEQHADKVADAVVAGKSAEPILNEMGGGGKGGGVQAKAVQMDDKTSGTGPTGPTTPAPTTPAGHPRAADLAADKSLIGPVATLEEFRDKVTRMKVLPQPKEKASVILRINKFLDAVPKLQTALIGAYKTQGPKYFDEYYTSRLPKIISKINADMPTSAAAAHDKIDASGAVNEADQWAATWSMVNYDAFGPEEQVDTDIVKSIGGVMKVYDAFALYRDMADVYKAKWETVGGEQAFADTCKSSGALKLAPAGMEADPLFKAASMAKVFPKPVYGFVGLGRDAGKATTFAAAIERFALNPAWYPSGVMIEGHASKDSIIALLPTTQLGKPSMFYLLRFDENTYDEKDRIFGHLADPNDVTKPGTALELQCGGIPVAEFLAGGKVLV